MIMVNNKILPISIALASAVACGSPDSDRPESVPAVSATRATDSRQAILFLGTSLTAGLGVEVEQAYPSLLQQMIDSLGLSYRVVNAGESGGTSAGGLSRIDWLLRQPVSVLVLELGANDGLRGQSIAALSNNLQAIVDRTKAEYPKAKIVIVGMEALPNMGRDYTGDFRKVFVDLAQANDVALVPFLLDGVGGVEELNQADGIHPTAAGHRILAANVWRILYPVLDSMTPDSSD